MKEWNFRKYIFCVGAFVLAFLFFTLKMNAQNKSLMVVANAKGAPDQMSMPELKKVLKGEKQRWNNSTPVVIALMKSSTEPGATTGRKIFDMSADEFNKYWLALVFQGKAKAPMFFHSASELEVFIAETPGAIGVVDTATSEKTRQITIDGKKSF